MEGFGRRSATGKPHSAVIAKANGDNRFAPRRKSDIPAQIFLESASQSLPCMIRDMSTTGAKLDLRDGWDNPFRSSLSHLDRFWLIVRMDRVMYDCKIIRRGEKELGVKFMSAPRPMPATVKSVPPAAKPKR